MPFTKEELRRIIEKKRIEEKRKHEEEMQKLNYVLAFIDSIDDGQIERRAMRGIQYYTNKERQLSLREKLEIILGEVNSPLTSRMLMQEYNIRYPERSYDDFYKFSSVFSQQYRKLKSKIVKYSIKDAPMSKAIFYCLQDWFENEELKEEYKEKINELVLKQK